MNPVRCFALAIALFGPHGVAGLNFCTCKASWDYGGFVSTSSGCPSTSVDGGYQDGFSWCEVDAADVTLNADGHPDVPGCYGAERDWIGGGADGSRYYMWCDPGANGDYAYESSFDSDGCSTDICTDYFEDCNDSCGDFGEPRSCKLGYESKKTSGCNYKCCPPGTGDDEYGDDFWDDDFGSLMSGACDWTTNWYPIILTGSIVGALLTGIPSTILGSLPCCCGKCLETKKVLAYIGLVLGIISMFIPLIVSMIATGIAIDEHCGDTACAPNGCTAAEEQAGRDVLNALGFLVAYTVGHGYIALLTGIAGIVTSACTLCNCCKAKDEAAPAAATGVTVMTATKA